VIISLLEPILAFTVPDPQHKRKLAKISKIWTSKGLNQTVVCSMANYTVFKGKLFTLQILLCLIITLEGPDVPLRIRNSN
jgi:hypothetical protein